jgi:hypothetical protein
MMKRIATMLAPLAIVLLTSCATTTHAPAPVPAGPMLSFRWMRSGEPVANMNVVLMRGLETVRGKTDANGMMAGLAGGFSLGIVSSPNDTTYGIDVVSDPATPGVVRVPEPVRIRGRVESATAGARIRLRAGFGPRKPAMTRHTAEERTYPRAEENKVVAGIELPPVASRWDEITLDASGAFTTNAITSESDPQLVALDDAGGMTTLEAQIPSNIAPGATIDAGTIRIGAPIALDVALDLPPSDLPVTLMASVRSVTFDPADRALIARHLSLLDQFDDAMFEFATARMPYSLELNGTTRIAGLPPFSTIELDVFGPKPGLALRRVVQLAHDHPTEVRITAADLDLSHLSGLPPVKGRVVLAGSGTPVANAMVVYSDYPVKQEARTDADGNFTMPQSAPPRKAIWFIDARASHVPETYRPTAIVPATDPGTGGVLTLELPLKPESPKESVLNPLNLQIEGCTHGVTNDDQYPACQGAIQTGFEQFVQGVVHDCVSNGALNALQFNVERTGNWALEYSYTPFLLYGTGVVEVPDTTWIANMQPVSNIVDRIILRFCSNEACTDFVPSTPFQISSFLTDPDSLEGTSDKTGNIVINCINTNPLYVYVNFIFPSPRVRFFYDDSVYIIGDTGAVKMKSAPALAQPWSQWRKDAHPFRP